MTVRTLLHRARRIPAHRWAAVLRVFPVVVGVRAALWVLPYRRIDALTRPAVAPVRRGVAYAQSVAWAAERIGEALLGDKPCLTQALAARWLLARAGYDSEVRIGGRRQDDGAFEAHAWLVSNGQVVVGGRQAVSFVEMSPLIPGAPVPAKEPAKTPDLA